MLLFPRSFEEDIRIFTFMAPVTFLNNVLQLDPPRETLSFTLNLFGVRVCSSISHLRSEIKKARLQKISPGFPSMRNSLSRVVTKNDNKASNPA